MCGAKPRVSPPRRSLPCIPYYISVIMNTYVIYTWDEIAYSVYSGVPGMSYAYTYAPGAIIAIYVYTTYDGTWYEGTGPCAVTAVSSAPPPVRMRCGKDCCVDKKSNHLFSFFCSPSLMGRTMATYLQHYRYYSVQQRCAADGGPIGTLREQFTAYNWSVAASLRSTRNVLR